MRADDLAHSLGEEPLAVLRYLADYEASGVVTRLPDGRYAPTKEALLGARMGD
jgi:DNA processing protein